MLFVGRSNFLADRALRDQLVGGLAERGCDVSIYEGPYETVQRRIDPRQRLQRLPWLLRHGLKALALTMHPSLWWFYLPSRRRQSLSVEFGVQSLAAAVAALPGPRLVMVGRSAGARIASLVADAVGLDGVICLGFPFRHPEGADEPERYRHLARLRTPCLIIQGDTDEYGGREIDGTYALSAAAKLEFIAADHEFRLAEPEARRLLDRMARFIGERSRARITAGRSR